MIVSSTQNRRPRMLRCPRSREGPRMKVRLAALGGVLAVAYAFGYDAQAAPIPAVSAAASCTHSKALFANPIRPPGNVDQDMTYAEVFQRHTWVGAAYSGTDRFSVLAWHPGARRPRVL